MICLCSVDLDGLTWKETSELTKKLRQAGVEPVPSERQLAELQRLIAKLGLGLAGAAGLGDLGILDEVKTGPQASARITALRERLPEVTDVSKRQLRLLQDLIKRAGLTEAAACARVEAAALSALTGGAKGTASRLITLLKQDQGGR